MYQCNISAFSLLSCHNYHLKIGCLLLNCTIKNFSQLLKQHANLQMRKLFKKSFSETTDDARLKLEKFEELWFFVECIKKWQALRLDGVNTNNF